VDQEGKSLANVLGTTNNVDPGVKKIDKQTPDPKVKLKATAEALAQKQLVDLITLLNTSKWQQKQNVLKDLATLTKSGDVILADKAKVKEIGTRWTTEPSKSQIEMDAWRVGQIQTLVKTKSKIATPAKLAELMNKVGLKDAIAIVTPVEELAVEKKQEAPAPK